MYCPYCNNLISDEANFCKYCGNPIKEGVISVSQVSDSETQKLVPATCTNCGSPLTLNPDATEGVCPYCETKFIVREAINNYSIGTVKGNIQVEKATINLSQKSATSQYYICPKCHSENIQRLSIAFKEGHTNVNVHSENDSWTNHKEYITTGVQETDLAASIAPPKRESYKDAIIGVGILYIIAWLIILFLLPKGLSPFTENIICWGINLLFAFILFSDLKGVYNQNKTYPQRVDEWMNSWICKKCGHVFVKYDP